jgi:hypothetical protein
VAAAQLDTAASPTSFKRALRLAASLGDPEAMAERAAATSCRTLSTPSVAVLAVSLCFLTTRAVSLFSAARQSSVASFAAIAAAVATAKAEEEAAGAVEVWRPRHRGGVIRGRPVRAVL